MKQTAVGNRGGFFCLQGTARMQFFKFQFVELFAAGGGHAFPRGEGGFFIAHDKGDEKDG